MNADRRKAIDTAIKLLEEIKDKLADAQQIVRDCESEEQECYDNLSEGLQAAERGQRMEEVAGELGGIADELEIDIDDFVTRLDEAKN